METTQKDIINRMRDRRRRLLAKFPNAVLDVEQFVSKFIDQFEDLEKYGAFHGFHWIDESKPQTLDNLGWSEVAKESGKVRKTAATKKEREIQSRDLTPQQWVAELLEERSRINRT